MDIDEPTSASTSSRSATAAPNGQERVDLLDDEGALTLQLEQALRHVFLKYATPSSDGGASDAPVSNVRAESLPDDRLQTSTRAAVLGLFWVIAQHLTRALSLLFRALPCL